MHQYTAGTQLLTNVPMTATTTWTATNSTVAFTAPVVAGTPDAFKLTENSSNVEHYLFATHTGATGTQRTFSVFYSSASSRSIGVAMTDGATGGIRVTVNSSGTITAAAAVFGATVFSGISGAVTATSGGYIVSITGTNTSATRVECVVYMMSGTNSTYTGNGTSNIVVWNAQLNTGSSPGTFIPRYVQTNQIRSIIQGFADRVVAATQATFTDGSGVVYWSAAPFYANVYSTDFWYASHGCAGCFTNAQIVALLPKFATKADGSGYLPTSLAPDATGANYSGCSSSKLFDGAWFLPQLELLYYQRSGVSSQFSTDAAALKAGILLVPLNGTTHMVTSPSGSEIIPWGFQDGIKFTGDNLMGSLNMYASATAMATMYTVIGDSANATTMTNIASAIASGFEAIFWNGSDGMYHAAASGASNDVIDIMGSAYAVYLGLSTHAATVSAYLVSHYSTLTLGGFWRQSSANWPSSWNGNMCGYAGGGGTGTYDDGNWSVGHEWIYSAMATANPGTAQTMLFDFGQYGHKPNGPSANPGLEWVTSAASGVVSNLESPMAALLMAIQGGW